MFELGYTGSVTHKLWKRFDQNEDAFAVVGGAPGPRPFQNFLHGMLTSKNEGGSDFNGLSAKLEQRSRNGLFYLVNYQWSKNLDNNSGEADANDTSYSTHFSFDRSYSNYDTSSRAVGSAGYELPFGRGKRFLNQRRHRQCRLPAAGRFSPSSSFAPDFPSRSPAGPALALAALMFHNGPTWLRAAPMANFPNAARPMV